MTNDNPETERRYEVAPETTLPTLVHLPKVVAVELVLRSTVEAVYSDTDDLALADADILLRRRTGGTDAGWHLRLPSGGDDRSGLDRPLDDDESIPQEFTPMIRAWVRDRELRTVATLSTGRVVHRLIGEGGKVLAEVSDDLVTARARPRRGGTVDSTWREWEIELVHGSHKLLTAATELFTRAGASASAWPSKLHRALDQQPQAASRHRMQPNDRSPAGAVVMAYAAEQVAVILTRDVGVRQEQADALFQMWIAAARLRSTLSTYRPLFDRAVTDPIRAELKWLTASLGAVRAVHVQQDRLRAAVAMCPAGLSALAPEARVALLADLDSTRYFRLLDSLDELVAHPPFSDLAAGRARTVLRQRVRHTCSRLYALVSVGEPDAGADHELWLYQIRRAGGRVRYAAEAAEPALGRSAGALAAVAEQLLAALGEYSDGVIARAHLEAMGTAMFAAGQNPFAIGRLHAVEQARSEAAEEEFFGLWTSRAAEHLRHWIG